MMSVAWLRVSLSRVDWVDGGAWGRRKRRRRGKIKNNTICSAPLFAGNGASSREYFCNRSVIDIGRLGAAPFRRHLCSAVARTQGLMRHGPMDWTPGLSGPWGMTPWTPGRLGNGWTRGTDWRLLGAPPSRRHLCSARARTHGLMRHGPMDWTVGTFGTVGNDALDAGTLGDRFDSGDGLADYGDSWA